MDFSSAPTQRVKIQPNAGKRKRLQHHTMASCVGNICTRKQGKLQGEFAPFPLTILMWHTKLLTQRTSTNGFAVLFQAQSFT